LAVNTELLELAPGLRPVDRRIAGTLPILRPRSPYGVSPTANVADPKVAMRPRLRGRPGRRTVVTTLSFAAGQTCPDAAFNVNSRQANIWGSVDTGEYARLVWPREDPPKRRRAIEAAITTVERHHGGGEWQSPILTLLKHHSNRAKANRLERPRTGMDRTGTGGLAPNAIAVLGAALLIGVRLSNIAAEVTSGSPSGASGQFLVSKIVHVTQHRNRRRRLHDAIVEIPLAPAS
jgi:hypothetical protein